MGHVARTGETKNAYNIFVVKPERRRPRGRPRRRWEYNMEGNFKKQGTAIWIGFIWLMIGTSGELL